MMGSYTFSKTLGLGHFRQIFNQAFGTAGYNVAAQDNYNYNEMKSYQPFDLPHVFNFLLSYDLPFGKGKKFLKSNNFVSNLVFGGWNISGIARYQSGPLLEVQAPANTLGTGVLFTFFKKANVGTGPIRTGIDRTTLDPNDPSTRWFNTAAFTTPGNYDLGNVRHLLWRFSQSAGSRRAHRHPEADEIPGAGGPFSRSHLPCRRVQHVQPDFIRQHREPDRERKLRPAAIATSGRPPHHHGASSGFLAASISLTLQPGWAT